jgi:predicted flap endonuclease-1-like 5' DNA nuclease
MIRRWDVIKTGALKSAYPNEHQVHRQIQTAKLTNQRRKHMFEQNVTLGPGTGTFTSHTLEIITMLLVAGLLGLWLGWILWNRYKQTADKLRLDLESQIATLNAITSELNSTKNKLAISESDNASLRSQLSKLTEENSVFRDQLTETGEDLSEIQERNRQLETELGLSFDAEPPAAETIPLEIETTVDQGDKQQEDAGAETPATTADTDTPEPQSGGATHDEHLPDTWNSDNMPLEEVPVVVISEPVVVTQQPETPPETPAEVPVVVARDKDDLTVVEGIGPKIQELLYQYGITTYRQLAETDVAKIKEILAAAGPQLAMHDPGTWPSQANLAANEEWENLKSIQGFLKGGKKPD